MVMRSVRSLFSASCGVIAGGYSGLSWAVDALLISLVLGSIADDSIVSVLGVSMLHDGFAALWLLFLLLFRRKFRQLIALVKSRDALFCMLGALFGGPLAMTCYLLSIHQVGVAVTTTVTASYPLMGAFLSMIFLKERVSRRTWIGLTFCLVGVVLTAYTPGDGGRELSFSSLKYAIIAALGWASESVVCAYGMRNDKITPSSALLLREATSAVVYLLVILLIGRNLNEFDAIGALFSQAIPVLSLLVLTAGVGMSSFLAWYSSIEAIGPARALGLNITYAAWGVILSLLFLNQAFYLPVFLGSLLVLLGVCYAMLPAFKSIKE